MACNPKTVAKYVLLHKLLFPENAYVMPPQFNYYNIASDAIAENCPVSQQVMMRGLLDSIDYLGDLDSETLDALRDALDEEAWSLGLRVVLRCANADQAAAWDVFRDKCHPKERAEDVLVEWLNKLNALSVTDLLSPDEMTIERKHEVSAGHEDE